MHSSNILGPAVINTPVQMPKINLPIMIGQIEATKVRAVDAIPTIPKMIKSFLRPLLMT